MDFAEFFSSQRGIKEEKQPRITIASLSLTPDNKLRGPQIFSFGQIDNVAMNLKKKRSQYFVLTLLEASG